jgi:hypothetical protein
LTDNFKTRIIGVIGAGACGAQTADLARRVGGLIAKRGAALICGGLGGVMEAACQGAAENGGLTIGILPTDRREEANRYVKIPIVTDMGYARNVIIVQTAQALIAMAGEHGTLSEIAIALKLGKPVISVGSWREIKGVRIAGGPDEAVEAAFESIG